MQPALLMLMESYSPSILSKCDCLYTNKRNSSYFLEITTGDRSYSLRKAHCPSPFKGVNMGIGELFPLERGEEQNKEEGEMVQKKLEEGEIGGKSREEGEKET